MAEVNAKYKTETPYPFIINGEAIGVLLCEVLLITGEIVPAKAIPGYYLIQEETASKYNIKIPGI